MARVRYVANFSGGRHLHRAGAQPPHRRQSIEEVLAFPHEQSAEDLQRYLGALLDHDTTDRLPGITAPTLVLAGGRDSTARPELRRAVAALTPWRDVEDERAREDSNL